jgi:acid phosphatase
VTVSKALVLMFENHEVDRVLKAMPYLARQASRYGEASAYFGLAYPSLPNYLSIAGGSSFGVHDDAPPAVHVIHGRSVFGQALARGGSARVYAEGMHDGCQLESAGRYAVKHNPWPYFVDERTECRRNDVPLGTTDEGHLRSDVVSGSLPNVGMVIPDMCHDAHDCSLATADSWLRPWLQVITSGPDFRSGRLVVVVTFDEDDQRHGNHIAAVVLHPNLRGVQARKPMNHLNLSAFLSNLSGEQGLRDAKGRPGILSGFGLKATGSN